MAGKEIDKIRNTAEIFPFVAKFVFSWTLEIVLDLLHGRKNLETFLVLTVFFFRLIIIFTVIFFFFFTYTELDKSLMKKSPTSLATQSQVQVQQEALFFKTAGWS